jgi:hypothetical protein
MQRPFRFGVLCEEMRTREAWFAKVRRERFGISYYMTLDRMMDAYAPLVERLSSE